LNQDLSIIVKAIKSAIIRSFSTISVGYKINVQVRIGIKVSIENFLVLWRITTSNMKKIIELARSIGKMMAL
jgi:hypothetical protein